MSRDIDTLNDIIMDHDRKQWSVNSQKGVLVASSNILSQYDEKSIFRWYQIQQIGWSVWRVWSHKNKEGTYSFFQGLYQILPQLTHIQDSKIKLWKMDSKMVC